jgi:hypothetical protein
MASMDVQESIRGNPTHAVALLVGCDIGSRAGHLAAP